MLTGGCLWCRKHCALYDAERRSSVERFTSHNSFKRVPRHQLTRALHKHHVRRISVRTALKLWK